jgi:hypothetical protein
LIGFSAPKAGAAAHRKASKIPVMMRNRSSHIRVLRHSSIAARPRRTDNRAAIE